MVTATILASCTKEQEDFFSDSSANRADATIAADVNVLTSAANGWLMQYFPESQQSFGGYNVIVRFSADGKAEVTDEFNPDTIYTSLYSVRQSAGIMLVFDSYNPAMHAYSDPSSPLEDYVPGNGDGKGLDGDFEFSILKATADSVVMKGKKTGNRVVLTPMKDGDWTGYLGEISDIENAMYSKKYGLHIGDQEIITMPSDRTFVFDYEENGEEVEKIASYVVTTWGLKFYEPVEILGQKISGFRYVEGADVFPAMENKDVTLNVIYPTLAEMVVEDWWCLAYSGLGEFGKQYWDVLAQVEEQVLGEQLYYAIFGTYDGNFGITFNSSGYWGSLLFNYQIVSDDEIMLQFRDGNSNDNGAWYVKNAYFGEYFVPPFATKKDIRTFKLTADDVNNPSYILMTDEADPTNTIVLYGSIVQLPLNN